MEAKAVDFTDKSLLNIRKDILTEEIKEVEYTLASMYKEWHELLKQLKTYETCAT
jgi:hypothetical protein